MKKFLKRTLFTIGAIILFVVLFFVGYSIKAKSEAKSMTPAETEKITDQLFSINDSFVNLYLIRDSNQYIAIDAGNNKDNIERELKKLNINPDQVEAVLLTHSDGDHVAAIPLFKNAKVYLSRQGEQMINGKTSRFFVFGNHISTTSYSLIDDQQIFSIGKIKIQGILTPGHTPGSMCYLVNDTCLFTGDALSLKDGKIAPFNNFFNMNTQMAIESMGKISQILEAKYLLTAHYGYTNDYENAVKNWKN